MHSKFYLKADELNTQFLESIKTLFQGKSIEILINDNIDETDYLLASRKNKEMLLNSIESIRNKNNLTEIKLKDLH